MKKRIAGIVIFIIMVAVFCGVDKAREMICDLLKGIANFFEELLPTLEPLVSNMGVKETAIALVLIGLVVGVSALIGCKLTKKDKRKVKRAIKDGVEIASTVSELTSAKNGKRK